VVRLARWILASDAQRIVVVPRLRRHIASLAEVLCAQGAEHPLPPSELRLPLLSKIRLSSFDFCLQCCFRGR
jgi:hypothetical protein